MMNNITHIAKKIFKKKNTRYFIIGGVLLVAIWFFFLRDTTVAPETLIAQKGDFLQQVSVSGNVVATQNLNLSFEQSGVVRKVSVKVSDNVYSGQLLASQDVGDLYARYLEMQAGIDLQKAKLAQLNAGASPEDVKLSEDAVASARQNLHNAYQSSLVSLNSAYNAIYNAYTVALYTQMTYFTGSDQQGIVVQQNKNLINTKLADVKRYLDAAKSASDDSSIDMLIKNTALDVISVYDALATIRMQCDTDIYYSRVLATDKASVDTQKTNINAALTTITSAEQSISSYKLLLDQAQNQLTLKKATPRITDLAVYEAQIKQAEASAQNIQAQIQKKQIYAPINGIITVVNAKVGSVASQDVAISMISKGKFQVESYVPEIYISLVAVGDEALVTLDAYGEDKKFAAKVISIDPAQTIKDGVATYKIILELADTQESIKTGMTANVVITTDQKPNVITVPQGIVVTKNGKKYVTVLQGENRVEKEIVIGEVSSLGQVEVVSGLEDGEVVIIK